MKRAIFYIFDTPPVESYYERYGMDYFDEMGWDVHVIDISPIVHPKAYQIVTTDLIKGAKRELFRDKKSFRKYAKSILDGAFFIFTTDFIYDVYFVHRCIRKNQHYGYMTRMDTNVEQDKRETGERIRGLFNKDFLLHIRNSLFIRIPRKCLPIKAADFFFLGGMANRDDYIRLGYTDEHTRICHIHSMDYEVYLKAKEMTKRIVGGEYGVLIDDYIPYHPDNADLRYYVEPKTYYREVNDFLHFLESMYGAKIIIALHPRSNLEVCRNVYPGFEMMKFKTAELIKDCRYVVSHFSTAIAYAAAFYKPAIICTTDTLSKIAEWRECTGKYAKLLGTDVVNISHLRDIRLPKKLTVDDEKYRKFIRLYLKADIDSKDERLGKRMYQELTRILMG